MVNYKVALLWLVCSLCISVLNRKYYQSKLDEDIQAALLSLAAPEQAEDPVFVAYQDSLHTYFGQLEIDLIRQYKRNFEQIKTQEDFEYFYSHAVTLRSTLLRTLQKHAEEHLKPHSQKAHELGWLAELLPGIQPKTVNQQSNWNLFFDYHLYFQKAQGTTGEADQDFFSLMLLCYDHQTHFPNWVGKNEQQQLCSQLGEGVHLAILKQMDKVRENGTAFSEELLKVQQLIMSDLLFSKAYCHPTPNVLVEIKQIREEVHLPERESGLIEERIVAMESF